MWLLGPRQCVGGTQVSPGENACNRCIPKHMLCPAAEALTPGWG